MTLIRGILLLLLIALGSLSACAPEGQTLSRPVQTTLTAVPATPLPRDSVDAAATPLPGMVDVTSPTQVPCAKKETGPAVWYDIKATLDWTTHRLHVTQYVGYRNETGSTQQALVFYVESNREPGQYSLRHVTTEDKRPITNYTLEDARLTIPLLEKLHVNCEAGLVLDYDLALPELHDGYSLGHSGYHLGYWGYGTRQINLGMWFPLVAVFDSGGDWITPRFHAVGEQTVLQMADFVVELTLKNAPENVQVAGPGDVTRSAGQQTWRFELHGGREVTLSISESFSTLSTTTASGVKVELYHFPDSSAAPRHALETAADALALYEELYGPYPYSRLVVVQGDFPDGMEFSGLVFVGAAWFTVWSGVPNDWLTLITAHEVSHQWFYAVVGNDQGNYPYIDEALAIYSELLYLERYYPDYTDWWWNFRIQAYTPSGYVDSTVYDFLSVRSYINAVYLRGALMMDSIRRNMGDKTFFAWLRQYVEQNQGHIVTPYDFWGSLPEDDYASTNSIREAYLRHADVLGRADDMP